MAWLGDLLIRLRAETADFTQDMGKAALSAERSMKQIESAAAKLGATLSAGAFALFVQKSVDMGDRLLDLSKTTTLSVENLAGLSVASKKSGGDLDSIAQSIEKLSVNMGKQADKFKAAGITAKDPLEAFKQLSDLFVQIEDPQLRAAAAAAALGKQWAGAAPLLSEGGKRIGEMVEEGKKLSGWTTAIAQQSDEFNDKLVNLVGTGSKMAYVANQLLPLMNTLADDLLRMKDGAKGVNDQFSPLLEIMKVVVILASDVSFVFTTMGKDMARAAENVKLIVTGRWEESRKLGELFREDAKRTRAELDAWQKKIMGLGTANQQAAKAMSGMGGGFDMTDDPLGMKASKAAEAARRAKLLLDADKERLALEKRMAAAIQEMENKRKSLFGTTEAQLMQERLYGVTIDIGDGKLRKFKGTYEDFDKVVKDWLLTNAKEIDARNQLIQRVEAEYGALRTLIELKQQDDALREQAVRQGKLQNDELKFQIDLLGRSAREQERMAAMRQIDLAVQERIRARTALLPEDPMAGQLEAIVEQEEALGERQKKSYAALLASRQDAERAWALGTKDAFQQYIDNASNAALQAHMLFTNAFRGMEDALVEFVKTGKFNFRSLADSIISDLIRIQIRQSMTAPLAAAMPSMAGLSNLFGGGQKVDLGMVPNTPMLAEGGPLGAGEMAIVGEKGPELFMPNVGGRVIPNSELGGGGGTTINVYPDMRGADPGAVAALHKMVRDLHATVEIRAVAAMADARRRGGA
jgi:lambda family phage tail tape measure protein